MTSSSFSTGTACFYSVLFFIYFICRVPVVQSFLSLQSNGFLWESIRQEVNKCSHNMMEKNVQLQFTFTSFCESLHETVSERERVCVQPLMSPLRAVRSEVSRSTGRSGR